MRARRRRRHQARPLHAQVAKGAVFIYDGYAGGVGLAEASFSRIGELLERTLELISSCDCEVGCPACIYSNKCGNGNVPLDKEAAVTVLKLLLDHPDALGVARGRTGRDRRGARGGPPPRPGRSLACSRTTRRA